MTTTNEWISRARAFEALVEQRKSRRAKRLSVLCQSIEHIINSDRCNERFWPMVVRALQNDRPITRLLWFVLNAMPVSVQRHTHSSSGDPVEGLGEEWQIYGRIWEFLTVSRDGVRSESTIVGDVRSVLGSPPVAAFEM